MRYLIKRTYNFNIPDRGYWIEKISSWTKFLKKASSSRDCIEINLMNAISKKKFSSFHIVLLSCFIELLKKRGYLIFLNIKNSDLEEFIHNDMSLTLYWRNKIDHIDSPDDSRLNLWRVVEGKSDEYEISVHRYFTKKFPEIDFFMLKSSLGELYFNIFDHSKANGVAFSYIHYDEIEEIMHIAICDFGLGIASTIRNAYPKIQDDREALFESIKRGVTARSNKHNAGFGLDNVISTLSNGSMLRIISNRAVLLYTKKGRKIKTKTYNLPFEFKGTLINFDLPISSFDKSEIEEEYTF
ncbi:hypothetical protein [uncultured Bacteroides sp.]|uniref:hypothetical protein n=1 Tax=uncultured Bacteroides sp. TaxID=162156 RepID=UPI002AABE7B0|nr:hypothetical protein [uncultured Bacteroides sp.]